MGKRCTLGELLTSLLGLPHTLPSYTFASLSHEPLEVAEKDPWEQVRRERHRLPQQTSCLAARTRLALHSGFNLMRKTPSPRGPSVTKRLGGDSKFACPPYNFISVPKANCTAGMS